MNKTICKALLLSLFLCRYLQAFVTKNMENFIVSARKYRPVTFESVVGQKSITATLKNAISKNHLAHAYLFFGPRGVGKTTCARIFAKTINCMNITADQEACNECESCTSFNESRSYNIHELDAASNNSVDDIRNLNDQVRIPPQVGKYSIYIIDEVHMLSLSAFNAFLKTLEEPPAHAIFILATTEKHKIIPTILSRCQIFDFNRIEINDIVGHLEYIAKKEVVSYNVDGLNVIAQKADGAMRDALSIFDQIVSFSGSEVTYDNVIENLNVLDYEYYFRLVDAFLEGDYSNSLLLFDEILNKGFDGHNFLTGLSKHLRDVLICKDIVTVNLLQVGASIRNRFKAQAEKSPSDFLLNALEVSNKFDLSYKTSNNPRLHVELALMQLSVITKKKSNLNQQVVVEKKVSSEPPVQRVVTQPVKNETSSHQPASPPPVPKTKVKNYRSGLTSGVLSVQDALKPAVKKDVKVEEKPQPKVEETVIKDNDFTLDDIKNAWSNYAETIIKTKQPRLYSIMLNSIPEIRDKTHLHLKLTNDSQKNNFDEIKSNIVQFLRGKLGNSEIELLIEVQQIENHKKQIYTDTDKLNYLIEKHPELGKMKQQLGLDFL